MTRTFIIHDGTKLVDQTDTFQATYFSDSCGCYLITDNNFIFKNWIKVCRLHQFLQKRQILWDEVLAHHRGFNMKHGRNPTEDQIREIQNDKQTERDRIRNL